MRLLQRTYVTKDGEQKQTLSIEVDNQKHDLLLTPTGELDTEGRKIRISIEEMIAKMKLARDWKEQCQLVPGKFGDIWVFEASEYEEVTMG